jgi:hypothetical protein
MVQGRREEEGWCYKSVCVFSCVPECLRHIWHAFTLSELPSYCQECLGCIGLVLTQSVASRVHYTHPHTVRSVSEGFYSPPCCLERVQLTLTLSGTSHVHWRHCHTIWTIPAALDSPSRYLEHLRLIGFALTPSGVFLMCINCPHDVWGCPDAFDSPL